MIFAAAVAAVLAGVAMLPGGCASAVNHFAFYPSASLAPTDEELPEGVSYVTLPTDDGETLEAYHLPATTRPGRLLLIFHGNGGNVTQRIPELRQIAAATGAAILGCGYRGYGASSGTPSEAGIYRDGEAALRYATETLGANRAGIILFGRSLGSTVATHLASTGDDFAGIVLVTPLSSGRAFAGTHLRPLSFMAGNSFNNVERAARIRELALVLHGTDDEVIAYAHGTKLHAALGGPKQMVTIPNAHHNDLELVDPNTYWRAIADFADATWAGEPAGNR